MSSLPGWSIITADSTEPSSIKVAVGIPAYLPPSQPGGNNIPSNTRIVRKGRNFDLDQTYAVRPTNGGKKTTPPRERGPIRSHSLHPGVRPYRFPAQAAQIKTPPSTRSRERVPAARIDDSLGERIFSSLSLSPACTVLTGYPTAKENRELAPRLWSFA